MNQTKINTLVNGLTSLSQKVYRCIPKKEFWDIRQVMVELKKEGSNPQHKAVQGCLTYLVEDKLIRKTGDKYQQVTAHQKVTLKEVRSTENQELTEKTPPLAKRTPVDILADLGAKMADLSSYFDDGAIEIQEYIEAMEAKAEKMQKLQALLKSLQD